MGNSLMPGDGRSVDRPAGAFMEKKPTMHPESAFRVRTEEDGSRTHMICQVRFSRYCKLSKARALILQLCDGSRTVAQIANLVAQHGGPRDCTLVVGVVQKALKDGWLQLSDGGKDEQAVDCKPETFWGACRSILTWKQRFCNVDVGVDMIYRHFGHWFFSLPARSLAVAIVVCGIAAHILAWRPAAAPFIPSVSQIWLLALLTIVCVGLHETAHAMSVKHFGRKVIAVGAGWFWVGPFFYVDTSDMWLAARKQRIIVSLAGPMTDLSIGALFSILSVFLAGDAASIAYLFATMQYINVFLALCPFLEYDGYYILVDLLNKPNLRRQSFRWFAINFEPKFSWMYRMIASKKLEFMYVFLSILYLIALLSMFSVSLFVMCSIFLQGIVTDMLSVSGALAVAVIFSVFVAGGLFCEMRQMAYKQDQ